MKIRFTENRTVDDHRRGTSAEESYKEGQVYDLDAGSCEHWVNRGVAEYVTESDAKAARKKTEEEAAKRVAPTKKTAKKKATKKPTAKAAGAKDAPAAVNKSAD